MHTTIIEVAEIHFSSNPQAILEAPSLGSCVGLDPTAMSLGGVINRTAALHIKTGKVHVSVAGNEIAQL